MKYKLLAKIASLMAVSDDMPRLYDVDTKKRQHRYSVLCHGTAFTKGKQHRSLKSRANRSKQ